MDKSTRSILIVDDDVGILTACAESLMLDGYQVDAAESGEKALEMIPRKKYHLIVTDLMMGEVDGLQVLRFAKEFSPFSEVIVLTAHGSVDTAVEAMKLGSYDYLSKPFDPYRLDTAVKRALEHQTLLRELSGLKEILRLYDATKTLSNIREEHELLNTVARFAAEIGDADGSSILTLSPDEKHFVVVATHGTRHGVLMDQRIAYVNERVGKLKIDEPASLSTPESRRYFQLEHIPGFGDITASLSVPIFYRERLVAVMNLARTGTRKPPFGNEELRLIAILCAQLGYAIENARLFAVLRDQSNHEAFSRLHKAFSGLVQHPGFQSLPNAVKSEMEELMTQCRSAFDTGVAPAPSSKQ